MRNNKTWSFSWAGFILFFLTIAGTSSCSIMIFQAVNKASGGNIVAIIFAVLGSILTGTIICTIIDIIRRKTMVDTPTQKILSATNEIAKGNFNVRMDIRHPHKKFTEYDKIMENINKMSEELGKTEILKADFVSNVSHEIKTPLSIIQNYIKLIKKSGISKEDKDKYLDEIMVATKRLTSLVTNILKLNKLENQTLDFDYEKFNLGEELRQIVLAFESSIESKELSLDLNIDDITIYSSKELLEIVWNNLLSNAIKFSNIGGKIGIRVFEKSGDATIQISDTGLGMDESVGKHIFDKFYQGDTSHASEGNGLGLALVKKVIDILGGEISVISEKNKGSTFTIKLRKN